MRVDRAVLGRPAWARCRLPLPYYCYWPPGDRRVLAVKAWKAAAGSAARLMSAFHTLRTFLAHDRIDDDRRRAWERLAELRRSAPLLTLLALSKDQMRSKRPAPRQLGMLRLPGAKRITVFSAELRRPGNGVAGQLQPGAGLARGGFEARYVRAQSAASG